MDNNEYSNILATCKKYRSVRAAGRPGARDAPARSHQPARPCTGGPPHSGTSMRSEKDQVLWVRVLSYFASQPGDCSKEISEVLHSTAAARPWGRPRGFEQMLTPGPCPPSPMFLTAIDQYNLLPPLQVVQILSQNSSVTLSVVKDYISSRMLAEDKQIKEVRSRHPPRGDCRRPC